MLVVPSSHRTRGRPSDSTAARQRQRSLVIGEGSSGGPAVHRKTTHVKAYSRDRGAPFGGRMTTANKINMFLLLRRPSLQTDSATDRRGRHPRRPSVPADRPRSSDVRVCRCPWLLIPCRVSRRSATTTTTPALKTPPHLPVARQAAQLATSPWRRRNEQRKVVVLFASDVDWCQRLSSAAENATTSHVQNPTATSCDLPTMRCVVRYRCGSTSTR